MKNILFIALCLISLSGICQVKDSIVGDTHYIVFPTGTSTATTVNYIYQIPTYSQWAWEYYQTRTVAHSAISFNVLTCTDPLIGYGRQRQGLQRHLPLLQEILFILKTYMVLPFRISCYRYITMVLIQQQYPLTGLFTNG